MVLTRGSVDIGCPVELVFDTVADERTSYDPSVLDAAKLTPGPLGVGTRFRSVIRGWRAPVETVVTITAYDRPHRLRTTTSAAGIEIASDMRFRALPVGTRIGWSCDIRARGAGRLLGPLLRLVAERRTAAVWRALKERLEGAPGPASARSRT